MLIPILILLVSVRTSPVDAGELNEAEKRMAQFLQLKPCAVFVEWSVEKTVELLRDSFVKRIRCGSQHHKICEDCLSVRRVLNITADLDTEIDKLDSIRASSSEELMKRVAVIFLNYFLSYQTACTVESIRYGYVGSCRVYNQCLAELHHYISPMRSSSYTEVLEAVENILREIKAVYEPNPSQPCFSSEKVLDELKEVATMHINIPREIRIVLIITGHLYLGECIDVGESVADFLDDIFLHYGDGCERVITQSGFTKLYNDLQMQRKGKHIDHGVPQNPCAVLSTDSHNRQATKIHDSSLHKNPKISETDNGKHETASDISIARETETVIEGLTPSKEINYTVGETETNLGPSVQDVSTRTRNQIQNKSRSTIWTPATRLPVTNPSLESTSATMVVPTIGDSNRNITTHSDNERGSEIKNSAFYHTYTTKNVTQKDLEIIEAKASTISSKRMARHTTVTEEHGHKNLANECLPSDDLLRRFLTNGHKVVTSAEFLQLCPALVQQAVSGVCNSRLTKTTQSVDKSSFVGDNETGVLFESATAEGRAWQAAVSVSIITAASLFGLIAFPVLKRPYYVYINAFFTGLAFGTMSGDVVLHIMPQYLGLHKHDDHEHKHEEESMLERYFPSYLQRQLVFWSTMYVLFIAECLFSTFSGENRTDHHGHSHDIPEIAMKDMRVSSDVETAEVEERPPLWRRIVNFLKPSNVFHGITSKAIVILLADTVHNFADGMAIAVGFSISYKDGLSTSIAVFFHELPHEIGDFAVLMNCGLGYWRAFLFNLISGFSAFLGLGVGVFTASVFREWLLCITAGLFFFVVMGEMLPDMRMQSKADFKVFIVKIVGTISGILTMICIAVYELTGV